jgi:hypothetical protein
MSAGTASIDIASPPEDVFDLLHDYSRRLEWDPFLRKAHLLDGAKQAGVGVSSRCVARRGVGGLAMNTEYVSFTSPLVAAVKMTRGPFFLRSFAASIRHDSLDGGRSRVTYRYNFTSWPECLGFLMEPIVGWILHRETTRRLQALKRFVEGNQAR